MKLPKIAKLLLILGFFLVWEELISSWILKILIYSESGQNVYPWSSFILAIITVPHQSVWRSYIKIV